MKNTTCTIGECDRDALARGWCSLHYRRWQKHGDPLTTHRKIAPICLVDDCFEKHERKGYCSPHAFRFIRYDDPLAGGKFRKDRTLICKVDGCDKPHHAHDYCANHAAKFRKYGDPLEPAKHAPNGYTLGVVTDDVTTRERTECWPSQAKEAWFNGVRRRVWHIAMVLDGLGDRPDGMEALHSCGQGHNYCYNPGHLRWGTHYENYLDSVAHGTNVNPPAHIGENAYNSILTVEIVREIRNSDLPISHFASKYGIKNDTLSAARNGKNWKHVK